MKLQQKISEIAEQTRDASTELLSLSTSEKNAVLQTVAQLLVKEKLTIQGENNRDIVLAREKALSSAMINRLLLSDEVIESMIQGLYELIHLPDPVGKIEDFSTRPNGLKVGRMRVPIGVIAMIYESRPNVTVDAAALCLKAGNGIILRGGSEAIFSNLALAKILQKALTLHGINKNVIQVIPLTDRQAVRYLLELEEQIDLVIPRGGEGLIRFVVQNSRIPVLKHYKGVCHIFVDKDADLEKALPIIANAKTQRPGVCNALEGILIHQDIADIFVPRLVDKLYDSGVEIRGCDRSVFLDGRVTAAQEQDWGTEFLDLIVCMKIVDDFQGAREYIRRHGSQHTESIITENYSTAEKFITEIDASAVMVNASTRFNDGGQLGLGAEIGISTTKLHAYGPMGLEELTTRKFVVYGQGQVRG
jgi:glutamate-5-semialdehyde dehydrogenase